MNTKSLLYITTIARERSISAAGKKLGISQPTLSIYLSRLERSLGTDLFIREKKWLIPTPAGKIYLDTASQILEAKDQTYLAIRSLTQELEETVVIGATPLRGAVLVAQIFTQFSKRFPNVRIEIKECYMKDLRTHVIAGDVDFALGSCYDSEEEDVNFVMMYREEVILSAPSFHKLANLAVKCDNRLTPMEISRFSDSPFVLMCQGTSIRAISDSIFLAAKMKPTVVFETNNNLVLSNMIRQGAGVGLIPRSSMADSDNKIVYFSLSPRYYLGLGAIVKKGKVLSEAERYFIYLVMRQDRNNPLYTSAYSACARAIYREFENEG
ncbi:LysR family transcriptional regulator [Lacrimispora sp. 38-1]|uniref:LysR family transcriptional regulator n=1 Tax=Lacrimispora sp. 38-1 TaxID=3125778 RepID=UPI003CF181C3